MLICASVCFIQWKKALGKTIQVWAGIGQADLQGPTARPGFFLNGIFLKPI